jgi:hypothetical protein
MTWEKLMTIYKKCALFFILTTLIFPLKPELEAITYVTDTGGYAYDEARAVANLAPAIALSTVAIAGIIAIAVQNSHDHSSSSSNCHYDCHCSSSSCRSSSSSCHY